MKKAINILIIISVSLFLGCSEDTIDLVGLGTITGRVVEAESFNPIANAKITLSPTSNTVFSDEDGYFLMEGVEAGDYSVDAQKESYLASFEATTVTTGIEVNVIFEMEDENALNKPPLAPTLITPADGSEEQELSLDLVWSSSDPDDDEITYRLELKNDFNNEVIKVEDLTDTLYVVSNLKYGTKYFWQITATDGINSDVLSMVSSFKTKLNPENRFVYVEKNSNNNNVIYSSDLDESLATINKVQLTLNEQNSWRPRKNQASNLIAYLRTYNNETHIFTMNPDGSNMSKVTSTVNVAGLDLNEMDFSWSSNGEKLMYAHYNKLYTINKDGSGLALIYETIDGSFITECDWSNDGTLIALKTNDTYGYNISIFTIDMSGAIITNVLSGVSGAAGGLNLSIDNKLLVYSYDVSGFEDSSNRQLNSHIFIYEFESATATDISSGKEAGTIDIDPRFTPNEADIIFVNTSNDGISTKSIYTMDILDNNNTEDNRKLLFSNANMPDWE